VERLLRLLKPKPPTPPKDLGGGVVVVGRQRISMLSSPVARLEEGDDLFVGLVLGSDGAVVEGPVLSRDKGTNRAWVHEVAQADPKARGQERPGAETIYSFRRGRHSLASISSKAKVIAPYPALLETEAPESTKKTGYEVELTVRYTHAIFATIPGPPGLTREQLEAKIDEDFPHITGYQAVPVDVDWTLESHQERGAYTVKVRDPDG
jgi:hypothetical protein